MGIDETILRALNGLAADPAVATLAYVLSSPWMLVMVALPLVGARARWKQWRVVLAVACTVGMADVVSSHIIKPIVGRVRPCRALADLEQPVRCGVGRSFPSSHAATGFALATSAAPTLSRGGWILFPLAAGVALSRVVLGVHYPSDILVGALLGMAIGSLTRMWLRRTSPPPPPHDPPSPSAPDPPAR